MGRNEIRLRRSAISSGRIAQHRNYGDIMARHERDVKLKRIIRAFVYFLAITFMVILFFIVHRIQQNKAAKPEKPGVSLVLENK